jgi:DNA-binding transcriptional regulator YiaG
VTAAYYAKHLRCVPVEVLREWETGARPVPADEPRIHGRSVMGWERCALLRRREGVSIKKAAARAGVSRVTYAGWERGRGAWYKNPYNS